MAEGSTPKRYAIRDWPEGEQPRERLLAEGVSRLTTAELLAIILRTGSRGQSAVDLARALLQSLDGLAGLEAAGPATLAEATGVGPAKTAQIKAALELGRRMLAEVEQGVHPRVTSSQDVVALCAPRLRGLQHERCDLIFLNGGNDVMALEVLSEGSLTESPVNVRAIGGAGQPPPCGRHDPGSQPPLRAHPAERRRSRPDRRVDAGGGAAADSPAGSCDHRRTRSLPASPITA